MLPANDKYMHNIADNLNRVHRQIQQIADRAGRDAEKIQLLAVSKGQPATAIRTAYELGQRHFGENYLQEALEKQQALADLTDICWHFIGPLQSNKTRKVAEQFDWVHSVDRYRVAERLSTQRPANRVPLNVCLQVNIDSETSKSGIAVPALPALAGKLIDLPHLNLRGLMCIPRSQPDLQRQRIAFAHLAAQLNMLQDSTRLARLDTLSMGMSDDLEAAILEGSTIVRIGTAIFGPRQTTA